MWFDEGIFYQIYPLGFCGAERVNDFGGTSHRLGKIEAEIPRLKELGITAVIFNPLFESERHGYDTIDFFRVDRRLGTNEEFKALVGKFHEAGIRVVLDGVFHHTGREFMPFKEVREKREGTDYRFWFQINFAGNSPYNDGFAYDNWEGHAELVKLRLENCDLQRYLMDAVRFWIDEFGIDGLRLDVCYSLPPWFMEMLRATVREKREDFFLVGEVIHCGNFAQNICPERLDSITNYECFKGMVSAFNSSNLFEIEHSLTRLFSSQPWALYTGKHMLNFLDNHDVLRVCTALKDGRNLLPLYTLLFTIPGIPCVYYGSEFGAEGDKSDNDYRLRPCIDEVDKTAHPEIAAHIRALAGIRKNSRALCYGSYAKVALANTNCAFERQIDGERVIAAFNIADAPCELHLGGGTVCDLITGEELPLDNVSMQPHSSRILICR
ncbi:MAG: maltodextrin glucosidase [Clostridia bacterium]|nr:maltodextrin glucosidase [Clostridia bacterium]